MQYEIKFEQPATTTQEEHFQLAISALVATKTFPDVRDYKSQIIEYLKAVGMTDQFAVGNGGSHIWLHRMDSQGNIEPERWCIIMESVLSIA